MRYDEDRLRDIIDAIEAIQSKVDKDRSVFDSDHMIRVWCLHHITIIGEAASGISQDIRDRYPSTPWKDIIGMRNAIIHGYFHVDWDQVWNVVQNDLAPLRKDIESILKSEGWEA